MPTCRVANGKLELKRDTLSRFPISALRIRVPRVTRLCRIKLQCSVHHEPRAFISDNNESEYARNAFFRVSARGFLVRHISRSIRKF